MIEIIKNKTGKIFFRVLIILSIIMAIAFGGAVFYGSKSIHDLFKNNEKLKLAIANLTKEDQIGYAKVLNQTRKNGRLYTTLKFVETARDNKLKRILEKEYTIEGDVIFFDALVVTFEDTAVIGGKRSLYLWRRVYGENMAPVEGLPIEVISQKPNRYADLLHQLHLSDQEMFWEAIWSLANDPEALKEYGIKAIYGNVVYKKLKPGLIYVFKIGARGTLYPETIPDL